MTTSTRPVRPARSMTLTTRPITSTRSVRWMRPARLTTRSMRPRRSTTTRRVRPTDRPWVTRRLPLPRRVVGAPTDVAGRGGPRRGG